MSQNLREFLSIIAIEFATRHRRSLKALFGSYLYFLADTFRVVYVLELVVGLYKDGLLRTHGGIDKVKLKTGLLSK
jgi:hypothetical protein